MIMLIHTADDKGFSYNEEDSLFLHLLEHWVGDGIAVLDGVHACIDRRLNAGLGRGMHCNLHLRTMRLLDYRFHFFRSYGTVHIIGDNFDEIGAVKQILADGSARVIWTANRKKLKLDDLLGDCGVQPDGLTARWGELAAGGLDPRSRHPARGDGVAKRCIAIFAGVAYVTNGGEAGLHTLAGPAGPPPRRL